MDVGVEDGREDRAGSGEVGRGESSPITTQSDGESIAQHVHAAVAVVIKLLYYSLSLLLSFPLVPGVPGVPAIRVFHTPISMLIFRGARPLCF